MAGTRARVPAEGERAVDPAENSLALPLWIAIQLPSNLLSSKAASLRGRPVSPLLRVSSESLRVGEEESEKSMDEPRDQKSGFDPLG